MSGQGCICMQGLNTHPHSACHLPWNQPYRCTWRTLGCFGTEHRCGSHQCPQSIHLYLRERKHMLLTASAPLPGVTIYVQASPLLHRYTYAAIIFKTLLCLYDSYSQSTQTEHPVNTLCTKWAIIPVSTVTWFPFESASSLSFLFIPGVNPQHFYLWLAH